MPSGQPSKEINKQNFFLFSSKTTKKDQKIQKEKNISQKLRKISFWNILGHFCLKSTTEKL